MTSCIFPFTFAMVDAFRLLTVCVCLVLRMQAMLAVDG
jgi:hypothetical protein